MIDESTIRERAYALWEKDACPDGAAKFYWHLAREQLEAQVRPNEAFNCVTDDNGVESETHPMRTQRAQLKAGGDATYSSMALDQ